MKIPPLRQLKQKDGSLRFVPVRNSPLPLSVLRRGKIALYFEKRKIVTQQISMCKSNAQPILECGLNPLITCQMIAKK